MALQPVPLLPLLLVDSYCRRHLLECSLYWGRPLVEGAPWLRAGPTSGVEGALDAGIAAQYWASYVYHLWRAKATGGLHP